MVHPTLRIPQQIQHPIKSSSSSSSATSLSTSMMQSIRHWWTQSNIKALHISQDQLLQSCVQTPYIYTSFAGMNSVEFQRRKYVVDDTTAAVTSSSSSTVSNTSSLGSSTSGHNTHCNGSMNHLMNHHHDRRFYHTNRSRMSYYSHHHHHHHHHHHLHRVPNTLESTTAASSITPSSPVTETTTVIITHGFGSGLGFFYKNVDILFDLYTNVDRVVLVDWFGMGGSDRPPIYPKKRRIILPLRVTNPTTTTSSSTTTTQQAVNFFIEPFHEWFEQSIIERRPPSCEESPSVRKENIVLVGHSLGGYLCGQYAIKYPQHLSKLVLASPVGFSNHNSSVDKSAKQNQMYQQHQFSENFYNSHPHVHYHPVPTRIPTTSVPPQVETTTAENRSNNNSIATRSQSVEHEDSDLTMSQTTTTNHDKNSTNTIAAVMPSSTKSIIRILSTLWRSNVTPQQLIRICGATQGRASVYRKLRQKLHASTITAPSPDEPKGNKSAATTSIPSNANQHSDNDIQLLADYLYHVTVADPSGEFAMNALLEPTLVTIVPISSSAATTINEESIEPPHQQNKAIHTSTMNESATLSNSSPRDGNTSIPISRTTRNPNQSHGTGVIPSFLFPKDLIKNTTTSVPLPIHKDGGNGKSVPKKKTINKTYSAMGVSAREPLQELLAQTLDTSHGLQCVKVLYGSHDWMRPNEMIARQSLEQLHARTGIETSVNVVPNVGHHLYMESPVEFVKHIMN